MELKATDMTIEECAKKARKDAQTIRRWIHKGYRGIRLEAKKSGHNWLVSPEQLSHFEYVTRTGNQ